MLRLGLDRSELHSWHTCGSVRNVIVPFIGGVIAAPFIGLLMGQISRVFRHVEAAMRMIITALSLYAASALFVMGSLIRSSFVYGRALRDFWTNSFAVAFAGLVWTRSVIVMGPLVCESSVDFTSMGAMGFSAGEARAPMTDHRAISLALREQRSSAQRILFDVRSSYAIYTLWALFLVIRASSGVTHHSTKRRRSIGSVPHGIEATSTASWRVIPTTNARWRIIQDTTTAASQ